MSEPERQECPDGGRCHHACGNDPCFRVQCCGPLSGVYYKDRWPDAVRIAHGEKPLPPTAEELAEKIQNQLPAMLVKDYMDSTRCSVYLTYAEWKEIQNLLTNE